MGTDDKAGNKAEDLKGKVKETTGKATDDESLEAEGKTRPEQVLAEAGRREREGRLQEAEPHQTCVAPAAPFRRRPPARHRPAPSTYAGTPAAPDLSAPAGHGRIDRMRPTAVRRSIAAVAVLSRCSRLSACSRPRLRSGRRGRRRPAGRGAVVTVTSTSVDFAERRRRGAHGVRRRSPTAWARRRSRRATVSTDGDTATGQLDWSWKVGSKTWSYDTEVQLHQGRDRRRRRLAGPLGPHPRGAVAEGRRAARRDHHQARARRHPRRRRPADRHPATGAARRARQEHGSRRAEATRVRRPSLAQLVDVDAKAFVKQVTASGPKAFVQAIVYRRSDVPADGARRPRRHQGRAGRSPTSCRSRPTKDFAAAILGTVGPATAELVKDSEGRIKAGDDVGLSGLQKRYDEQLFGTRGATVVAVDEEGERRDAVHRRARSPASHCARRSTSTTQQTAQQALADVGSGECARRDPALDRRPRRGGERARLEGLQHRDLRPLRPGLDLQGGQRPRAPARRASPPDPRCPARRRPSVDGKSFKNYDDYPSSGLGEISFEDALANSCNTAFISQRDKLDPQSLAQAAAALGLGVDHDTGFPTYFGEVGERRQRDPGRGQHDRAGHRARLADGDGHRGGLGAQGLDGAAAAAARHRGASRRSRRSR